MTIEFDWSGVGVGHEEAAKNNLENTVHKLRTGSWKNVAGKLEKQAPPPWDLVSSVGEGYVS